MQIYSKKDILEVAKILKNGGIIAFPTETVFGLGVLSNSKENFLKLVKVKNRNPDKPFTLMISKIEQVKDLVEIDEKTAKIIKKFMPGPLTLVLKKKNNSEIPSYFDLNSGYIGIRIPNDKFILSLIDLVDCPLLVPSANKSNEKPAKNVDEIIKIFENEIDCVVNGECGSGVPSTVAKIDKENVIILREGIIKKEDLEDVKWLLH